MSLLWPILKKAIFNFKKTAVIDDQREWSYGKLLGGALFAAQFIEKMTRRKNVGILLPTCGATPVAILGCWLTRKAAVPFNFLLSPDELEYIIKDSDIDLLITVDQMLDYVGGEKVIPKGVKLMKLNKMKFKGIPKLRLPPRLKDDELAVLLYTSGTSGKPKGVMLTHGNLQSNVTDCINHAGLTEWDIFISVLPQFHSFGLTACTLIPLSLGTKVIYTARFMPTKILELFRKHKPGIFMAVPSMYGALMSIKSAKPEDFSSMTLAISGGEPLSDAIYESFKERFNIGILEGYGLTETSPALNWSTQKNNRKHSVGKKLPRVKQYIVDEHNNVLGPNEEGELLVSGPNVMKGYYKLPEMSAEVMTELTLPDGSKDSVFRTGDICKIDEDGYLFITGRKKEMIIVGGENIFPREIEEVLNFADGVMASAVIGKLDDIRGEVPIAFVEMVEGAEFDEKTLRAHCRDNLAQYKVPREIRLIDELPRNPTGKIMRRKLEV
ncbi:Long-chain-fatty-acid--CoA ligase [Poriferisphaera corsica]|uniref:Long-chain-fatty-acid--CoA ligase n=1 Tax=Poriferisphaera corsica TaxID=2528020 RepID=A0A517YYN1_9BACT|nr:AMP-binding protein [Poriferisphaera corsica]QDU35328.1 Long-chain-fatty-acid--CoA ligase [Poriferisphaera corsica]